MATNRRIVAILKKYLKPVRPPDKVLARIKKRIMDAIREAKNV